MHDVEVTVVPKLEGPGQGEGVHPGEDGVKEVTGDVEAVVAPAQLHHVTVEAKDRRKRRSE